jgi:cation:H+ antiporter
MLVASLLVLAGLSTLLVGGSAVVGGSVRLAEKYRVSPAVIGLTVVAFGTSAPEMAVSVLAAAGGNPDIALGNVFGSNIFNTLVVIGAAAWVAPLVLSTRTLRREIPICLAANAVVLGLCWTHHFLSTWEAMALLTSLLFFLGWCVWSAREEQEASVTEGERLPLGPMAVAFLATCAAAQMGHGWSWTVAMVLGCCFLAWFLEPDPLEEPNQKLLWVYVMASIGLLVGGADLLVAGALDIGISVGIEEAVLGLTVVAIGTSAPELVTSLVAMRQGSPELAVGNALGSNLFNLLGVVGLAGVVRAFDVAPRLISVDGWIALGAVALLPILSRRTGRLERGHGRLLVAAWGVYTVILLVMELA